MKHNLTDTAKNVFNSFHDNLMAVNNSKIFAGLVIITLNIASKFTTIKLSKTMEAFLKYTFSRNILIFAMAWMGTRDIYMALLITILVVFALNHLLNEESALCCLPEHFTEYHTTLYNDDVVTAQQIEDAKEVLKRAKKQKKMKHETGTNSDSDSDIDSDIDNNGYDHSYHLKYYGNSSHMQYYR
jgi:hypothetical protein